MAFLLGFFIWIILSIIVGIFANQRRGRSGVVWFLIALFISPVLAWLLAASMGEVGDTADAT